MPPSQNTYSHHTAPAPRAAEASSSHVNDAATSPSSLAPRPSDSRHREAQTMSSSSSSSRHHIRRRERISPAEFTMLTAAAAARHENAERTTTTASPPTSSRPFRHMMLTATARLMDAENAGHTTMTTRAGVNGAAQPVSDASRDTYDSFTDEYWYDVRNAALRGQQDRLRQQRRRPAEEGHGSEGRRAYAGLTSILHRLRSSTQEPK